MQVPSFFFFFYCFLFEWSWNWCCFSVWFLAPLLRKWAGWLGESLAYVLCLYFQDLRETSWCVKPRPENFVSLICCKSCPMGQIIWGVILWWYLRSFVVLSMDDLPFVGKPCLVILEFKMMLGKGLTFYFLVRNTFFLVQATWFLVEYWAVIKAMFLSVGSRIEDCGLIHVERYMSNFLHCWSEERRLE